MWPFSQKTQGKYTALIETITESSPAPYAAWSDPTAISGGKEVFSLKAEEQREFVLEALEALNWLKRPFSFNLWWIVRHLLKVNIPFIHDDIVKLLDWASKEQFFLSSSVPALVSVLRRFFKTTSLTPTIQEAIERLIVAIESNYGSSELRSLSAKLKELGQLTDLGRLLNASEAWADTALQHIKHLRLETKTQWTTLLNLCLTKATGSNPSQKWLEEANRLIMQIGFSEFKACLLLWFSLADKPRDVSVETRSAMASYYRSDPDYPDPHNADVLKGLAWACVFQEDKELARALTALAISAYRKIPHTGPRCVRLGNACVWALGHMPGTEGVGQLALLKARVKINSVQKSIDKAFDAAATRLNLPQSEIEEMAVPTYGLTEVGLLHKQLGDFTAELMVVGTSSTEIRWFKADGTPQKSPPKALKEQFSDELKELTQTAKEIAKMLPAQRDRLENLYLKQRKWPFSVWQERYLNHPLVGVLARRMIWQFTNSEQSASGIWLAGQLIGCDGLLLDWVNEETQVELWHPINDMTANVLAWRNWLVWHNVQQPFKQAHREIYVLTDAERQTRNHSNRFAAHIIKQHQFHALCGVREWKNKLRLMVDDVTPPAMKQLPEWGLRAEFWVESVGDDFGRDTTDSGTYLYLATDQIRFYPLEARKNFAHVGGGGYGMAWHGTGLALDPLPLEQIPPLVLTEIMRDVDLFVGVCSVGNDPNWADGRLENHERDYWYGYSFGNLSEAAKIRKQELERIVPRLKIAARCHLTDKFLRVQGDIRAYKIHLGSGNILMEPNDQYLCIVPAQGARATMSREQVFLPFEGDNMVAIILSKAFLLVEDKKISDPTIVRQLKL